MSLSIRSLDHLVLTVTDISASIDFYTQVLGMQKEVFAEGRVALVFGQQKINLHEHGKEFEPKAEQPKPGSADLCFLLDTNIEDILEHLSCCDIELEEGPVTRTGAKGPILSVYCRDPDNCLIELSNSLTD